MNETLSVIMNRRSIRRFDSSPIAPEQIALILQAGQYAPSAMNEQPWHFTVITNKDALHKLNSASFDILMHSGNDAVKNRLSGKTADTFDFFYHAPVVIVVSGEANMIAPQIDCALAIENMFLAAESLQIGCCWIHALNHMFAVPEGKRALIDQGIVPAENTIVGTAVFGHKADESPAALPRKENTVSYID